MKKLYLLIISLLVFANIVNVHSQITWQNTYGGTSTDQGNAVCTTHDGGFIAASTVKSIDGDINDKSTADTIDTDLWIVKTDVEGEIIWKRCVGGSQDEYAMSLIIVSDGGYLVAGQTKSNNGDFANTGFHSNLDIFLLKLNTNGEKEWIKCYGGSGYEGSYNVIENSEGNFLIAGSTYNSGSSGDLSGTSSRGWTDCFILKVNSTDGGIIWKKRYGGNLDDHAMDMIELSDGGYIFACDAESYAGSGEVSVNIGNNHTYDFWILRLNDSGNIIWKKNFGGTSHERPWDIRKLGNGNFIIAGFSMSTNVDAIGNHGGRDGFVVNMDSNGNKLWSKSIGGSGDDNFRDILIVSDTSFLLTGYTKSNDGDNANNHGSNDGWMVEMKNDGTILSNHCYGSDGEDRFYDIDLLNDKRVVINGYAGAANGDVLEINGPADIWLLKMGEPDSYETEVLATSCQGDSVEFGGIWLKEPGLYYDSLQTAGGVDSVIILTLDFKPSYFTEIVQSICSGDSVQFKGEWNKETGTYYDSLTTIEGCDSINILQLQMNPSYELELNQSICEGDSVQFKGEWLNSAGIFYDSLTSISGCDSVIVLSLEVNPRPESFSIIGETTPAALQDYLYSTPVNSKVTYHWSLEHGNIVSFASNNGVNIQWGEHDKGTVLVLAEGNNGCYGDTVKLDVDIIMTGVDLPEKNELIIYPNPAKDHLFIKTGDYLKMSGYKLKIINQTGAIVFETNVEEPLYEVNLSTWTGMGLYYVQVIDSGGVIIDIRKIVLQ